MSAESSSSSGRVGRSARLLAQAAQTTDHAVRRRLLEETVLRNTSMARSIAARYRRRGISQDSLEQVAHLALTRAAVEFDPSLDPDFLAYAAATIRGDIQRWLRDLGWPGSPRTRMPDPGPGVLAGEPRPTSAARATQLPQELTPAR